MKTQKSPLQELADKIFFVEIPKPLHSFQPVKRGGFAYHKYDSLATYANKTQAQNKCNELKTLGYDCYITFSHPFLIMLTPAQ